MSSLDIPEEGFIYFVATEASDVVKIGFAVSPDERLASLQTGNASELHFLLVIPAKREQEKAIHERFADLRIRGEWFRFEEPIAAFLDECESAIREVIYEQVHAGRKLNFDEDVYEAMEAVTLDECMATGWKAF